MGFAQFDINKVTSVLNSTDTSTSIVERKKYFDNIGVNIQNAHTLESAIKISGLDFTVEKRALNYNTPTPQDWNGNTVMVDVPTPIPDNFATVRSDTNAFLGIVGKKYTILQNNEAFNFLDDIIHDVRFETAGSYGRNSAKSFITVSTEPMRILGDDFQPYINILNSFDGSGAVRAFFSPVRLFCSNCIVASLKSAVNKVSIRHSSSLAIRMQEAKEMLLANSNYLEELKKLAEKLGTTPFSAEAFEAFVRELYPVNAEDTETTKVRNMEQIEQLLRAYRQDDLENFSNTAWRAVQAVADAESHKIVYRHTDGEKFANFNTVINGMPLVNRMIEYTLAAA